MLKRSATIFISTSSCKMPPKISTVVVGSGLAKLSLHNNNNNLLMKKSLPDFRNFKIVNNRDDEFEKKHGNINYRGSSEGLLMNFGRVIKREWSRGVLMREKEASSLQTNSDSTCSSMDNKENSNMKKDEQITKPNPVFNTWDFVKLFGVSIVGGTFGGMVGLGGNIILIPLITQLFPHLLSAKQIIATCLVTVVTAGFVGAGTLYFVGDNSVDIVTSILIATFAAFTARFGVKLSSSIQDRTLKLILACFMLFVAPLVSLLHSDDDKEKPVSDSAKEHYETNQKLKLPSIEEAGPLFVLGSIIGVMSGLLGVGGGILIVPALSFLWSDKSPIKKEHTSTKLVIGTSLAAMTIPSSVALYSHWRVGNVILKLAPILMTGSAVGAYSGGFLASNMDEQVLKHTFSLTMLLLGIRQFWKAL